MTVSDLVGIHSRIFSAILHAIMFEIRVIIKIIKIKFKQILFVTDAGS